MLYIIAGHGGGDPGATGWGYTEAELNRKLCYEIKRQGGDAVTYLDPGIDHFQAHTLGKMNIPGSGLVLEVHMDAFGNENAKGGHVIINSRFEPDEYDKALAQFCADYLPGRSQTIVKRNDLYNCNVCAQRGINYRLLECGFITNLGDNTLVRENANLFAKLILECFHIKPVAPLNPEVKPKQEPEAVTPSGTVYQKTISFKLFVNNDGTVKIDKVEVN